MRTLLYYSVLSVFAAHGLAWELRHPRAPTKVSYNHRSLTIDGEPTLWLAGSVHYPRFTPGMWPHALALAKEAGLNGITSYVFWNLHEEVRGTYDYSGRRNVSAFLQAAHDAGLWVHLRFGPYIDAEWDYGGFPWWLNSLGAETPKCLRCDDAKFETLMKTWLDAFIAEVRPFFASNGGPVAMVQIENELDCGQGRDYTDWSIKTALALNTGIPWSFCNNSDSCVLPDTAGIIYTGNANEGADHWFDDGNYDYYASQPAIWSEVEEGFDQWEMVGWNPQQPRILATNIARWYSRGGGGSSYYMFNGGNDYAWTAGDDDATKYATHGAVEPVLQRPNEPKFSHMKKLHAVLREHTAVLTGMPPPPPVNVSACETRTYTNLTATFTFVYNGDHHATVNCTVCGVALTLHPKMHALLSQPKGSGAATLVFDTNVCGAAPCSANPTGIGSFDVVASNLTWSRFQEPLAASAAVEGATHVASPGDFVSLNGRTSDYAWYTTSVSAKQLRSAIAAATAISKNSSTVDDVTLSVKLFAETVAHAYLGGAYVAFLNNEQHNGGVATVTASVPAALLLEVLEEQMKLFSKDSSNLSTMKLSILAMCVGLSADLADTGSVGDAGIDGTVMLGTVDLSQNGWEVQPRLYGEAAQLAMSAGNATWLPLKAFDGVAVRAPAMAPPPPHPNCSAAAFPFPKNGIECDGLVAAPLGDKSQDACVQACCDRGMSCVVWQWAAGTDGGCWMGKDCDVTEPGAQWLGGMRTKGPGPAPAPSGPVISPPAGWLQATFTAPVGWRSDGETTDAVPLAIDLSGANKGHAYLNGFDLGRYWYDAEISHTMQQYYQLPPDHINAAGVNRIVLFEERALHSNFLTDTSVIRGSDVRVGA